MTTGATQYVPPEGISEIQADASARLDIATRLLKSKRVQIVFEGKKHDPALIGVVHEMAHYGVELSMKAALAYSGVSVADIRRSSHQLVALFEMLPEAARDGAREMYEWKLAQLPGPSIRYAYITSKNKPDSPPNDHSGGRLEDELRFWDEGIQPAIKKYEGFKAGSWRFYASRDCLVAMVETGRYLNRF